MHSDPHELLLGTRCFLHHCVWHTSFSGSWHWERKKKKKRQFEGWPSQAQWKTVRHFTLRSNNSFTFPQNDQVYIRIRTVNYSLRMRMPERLPKGGKNLLYEKNIKVSSSCVLCMLAKLRFPLYPIWNVHSDSRKAW